MRRVAVCVAAAALSLLQAPPVTAHTPASASERGALGGVPSTSASLASSTFKVAVTYDAASNSVNVTTFAFYAAGGWTMSLTSPPGSVPAAVSSGTAMVALGSGALPMSCVSAGCDVSSTSATIHVTGLTHGGYDSEEWLLELPDNGTALTWTVRRTILRDVDVVYVQNACLCWDSTFGRYLGVVCRRSVSSCAVVCRYRLPVHAPATSVALCRVTNNSEGSVTHLRLLSPHLCGSNVPRGVSLCTCPVAAAPIAKCCPWSPRARHPSTATKSRRTWT